MASHTHNAAVAGSSHPASDHCQPAYSASGTEADAARAEDKAMTTDSVPTAKPTRPGRLRFASAGSSTLPMVMAAANSSVPPASRLSDGPDERQTSPTIIKARDAANTRSMPKRRAAFGAKGENSAKASMGRAAAMPINVPEACKSACIIPTKGPSAAKGARRLAASRATAISSRPRGRAAAGRFFCFIRS